MWKAKVYITLKDVILDPQGKVVQDALGRLGYNGVASVRVGKYMEVKLDCNGEEEARAMVEDMCRRFLANPVIENFRFEVSGVGK